MEIDKKMTRRNFLKTGTMITALGAVCSTGIVDIASATSESYATMIDLTKCDGCKNESIPKCIEACRIENEGRFPEPKQPIKDLWPQKTHDDWSKKRDVINQLTPYNWVTVQQVEVEGEKLFIPRRCMHCDNPPCANLCPFGALNKYSDGSVVINHTLCMGGAKCKAVCPWHIPQRQSGVGLYLKIQPIPAGGGVMYKCDLCHDRIKKGQIPACVEACEKRLGANRPLYFGKKEEMLYLAHSRAKELRGFIYGEKENGGTATLYVSKIPFEKIDEKLKEKKSNLHMSKVINPLRSVNAWAKGFIIAPLISGFTALVLVLYEKKHRVKEEKNEGKNYRGRKGSPSAQSD